jgi:hypothetical protein
MPDMTWPNSDGSARKSLSFWTSKAFILGLLLARAGESINAMVMGEASCVVF